MELAATKVEQHTLRGVLWMLGAVLSFAAMAVAVRELLRHMGILQILSLRTLVTLALVCSIMPRHVRQMNFKMRMFFEPRR